MTSIVYGMDEPKQSKPLLASFVPNQAFHQQLSHLPNDLHKAITTYTMNKIIKKKEWWYFDSIFIESNDGPCSLCYSKSGEQLAVGALNKAYIFDCTTKTKLTFFSHHGVVRSISYAPSGKRLVTGTYNGDICIFDIITGKRIKSFFDPDKFISVCYHPTKRRVVTGSWNGSVCIFNTRSLQQLAFFKHQDHINSVSYAPSGNQIVTACWDRKVRVFDVNKKESLALFAHDDFVNSVCYDPLGRHIATGSSDGMVRIFDIHTKRQIASLIHDGGIHAVCYHPLGNEIATITFLSKIRIFKKYDQYTFEQILLKKMLFRWLLIEKPYKMIILSPRRLLLDVATKNAIEYNDIFTVWTSLPKKVRLYLWTILWYNIKRFGKK